MKPALPLVALLALSMLTDIRVQLMAQEQTPTEQNQASRNESERLGANATGIKANYVAQVLETWRARQEAAKSFSFKWVAAVHSPTGRGPHKIIPVAGELDIDESGSMRLDWTSVNSRRRGQREEGEIRLLGSIKTVHDNIYTWFIRQTHNGFPRAWVSQAESRGITDNLWLSPIILALRPLEPQSPFGFLKSIQETGETGVLDGIPCRIL